MLPVAKHNKFNASKKVSNKPKQIVTGNCKLISKERFSVNVSYHAQLIDVFKSIPSRAYDPNEKTWNFSLSDYSTVMKKIRDLREEVSISELPTLLLRLFSQKSQTPQSPEAIDLSSIDQILLDALMPFQRDGICFGISKNGRCLLADDMGLGKTIQALGIAHYYVQDWPMLIVCPSSVRYLWMDSILTWLPSVPYHEIKVMTSGKDYVGDAHILITSYDLMSRCRSELQKINFGVCIMDESHFLKSLNSARSEAAKVLLKKARRVIMLSGTPALSRPCELYSQISAIQPSLFPSYFEFGIRYCNGIKNNFGWDFTGSSNMEELQLLLESQIMIRRLKSDVISQLPPKVRQVIILNPELVRDKTKEMKQCLENLEQEHMSAMEKRGALLSYYNATGKAKLKAIQ
ncbi:hypothetical protein L9F63_025302 [Diploptera punctata]|uniref:SWI/SNF-related matrix-associated actin-dependent regulator of chromatin subfamily A-like protein 1 n=1 Tax=Diploptera punctata TaxID=6984 RepID=A0AAD7ZC70_DIPPU|nr:hypothetical protein L9F63_025302 [Diploptera punctata]